MKTTRKPGPLTSADTAFWKAYQKANGLLVDGKPEHQVTGQIAIDLSADTTQGPPVAMYVLLGCISFFLGYMFGVL